MLGFGGFVVVCNEWCLDSEKVLLMLVKYTDCLLRYMVALV